MTAESELGCRIRRHLASKIGAAQVLRPVAGGGGQGADVWHAKLASNVQVAVKRHAHAGAGEVEFGVLQMLHRLGAPVARPLRWDPQSQILITGWVGSRTLATAMSYPQEAKAQQSADLRLLAHSLMRGCNALETAFAGIAGKLPLNTTGERQRRHAELRDRCDHAPATFARLAALRNVKPPPRWESSLHKAWGVIADALCASRLTFGGRDCTPRNVLTDGSEVWFVDFAVVGLDWPEARLAQYAATVGADAPGLRPESLLTHGKEQWYVESGCIESAQLDMHQLVLWSEVLRLLLSGKLGGRNSAGLLTGEKLRQALRVTLFPLATGTPAEPVRALLATVFA